MLLNVRYIAISTAVICFFIVGLIGWCSGFTQLTCCKRAIAGAIVAYIIMTLAAKAVNAVLINAIIQSRLSKSEEMTNDNRD